LATADDVPGPVVPPDRDDLCDRRDEDRRSESAIPWHARSEVAKTMTRVWTADTFVDFDHGLNKAINKICEALGDSVTRPRFVETART